MIFSTSMTFTKAYYIKWMGYFVKMIHSTWMAKSFFNCYNLFDKETKIPSQKQQSCFTYEHNFIFFQFILLYKWTTFHFLSIYLYAYECNITFFQFIWHTHSQIGISFYRIDTYIITVSVQSPLSHFFLLSFMYHRQH